MFDLNEYIKELKGSKLMYVAGGAVIFGMIVSSPAIIFGAIILLIGIYVGQRRAEPPAEK